MKKCFFQFWGLPVFLLLFLGVFMMSPVFANTFPSGDIYGDQITGYTCENPSNLIWGFFIETGENSGGSGCDSFPTNTWTHENLFPEIEQSYRIAEFPANIEELGDCGVTFNFIDCSPFAINTSIVNFHFFLPQSTPVSFTGPYSLAGIGSISTAIFDDFGSGGILEMIVGIFLGLMLLSWVINRFQVRKRKK